MKKTKQYTDSQFYVDGCSFLKNASIIVRNMTCDDKHAFGHDLSKLIRDAVTNFSLSYKESEKQEKLKLAKDTFGKLELVSIQLNLLKDVSVITEKQFTNLYMHLGLLMTQLNGWCNSLEK